jgi:hypothetical protein
MGGGKSSTTTVNNTPWGPQSAHLAGIMTEAGRLYSTESQMPGYQGPFTAAMNDTEKQSLGLMRRAADASGNFADTTTAQAGRLSGSYDQAQTITQGLASGDPIAQELARRAMEDPTQGILTNAAQYADNPYVDGMIDSVGRDVSRNLRENDLISLNLGAAGAGNMNSSRAGAAEGVLMRGAQDRLADVSMGVRGAAWDRGLAMAADQREAMFRNGLAASGQDTNTRALAQGQFMGLGAAGTSLQAMGVENRANQAAMMGQVGAAERGEAQRAIDENIRRYDYDQNRPWESLSRYYGIVGDKSWGGQTTQTAPKTGPSGLQTALGAVATVGGIVAAPFTGGASLAVTAAGLGALSSGMGGGGGAPMASSAYGGGGGGSGGGWFSRPGGASAYSMAGPATYAPSGTLGVGTNINALPAGVVR